MTWHVYHQVLIFFQAMYKSNWLHNENWVDRIVHSFVAVVHSSRAIAIINFIASAQFRSQVVL